MCSPLAPGWCCGSALMPPAPPRRAGAGRASTRAAHHFLLGAVRASLFYSSHSHSHSHSSLVTRHLQLLITSQCRSICICIHCIRYTVCIVYGGYGHGDGYGYGYVGPYKIYEYIPNTNKNK